MEEAIMDVIKSQQISSRPIEKVIVHPLVFLSIIDHYNRVAKDTRKCVVGVLLGTSFKDRQPKSYSNHRSTVRKTFKKLFNGMPNHMKIVEVGARDGLQNKKKIVPTSVKVELIQKLFSCGLLVVEVTGFVSPKWVPQELLPLFIHKETSLHIVAMLSDAKDVMEVVKDLEGARLPVLTPNMKE
ncbi:hypothetical protein R3W88_024411 [Solanum pinnatisectum]|uniref:JAB1/MPN/MOV34 metalloenzyme domain-containing protein n=1 Tax=Solanum pinnatisectum TaxID=50273 RepID=A0AAV9M053_9SOLN|nr:hypothetical protein R3W88_024411 [Solanum pinnatisectum]